MLGKRSSLRGPGRSLSSAMFKNALSTQSIGKLVYFERPASELASGRSTQSQPAVSPCQVA